MQLRPTLTVIYFILNVYVFSVGTLQGLLNYQAWTLIGATEFPKVHQVIGQQTLRLFLPFFLLSLPLNFGMIWLRHPAMSQGLLILVALLNLAIFIVTITLAIPIQNQLDQHQSVALIERLVWYHLYLRTLPGLIVLSALATLLYQLVGKVTAPAV